MAHDKTNNLSIFLTNTADAIRKAETDNEQGLVINPQDFEARIKGLSTFDATAGSDHILSGHTAYARGEKLVGTLGSGAVTTPTTNIAAAVSMDMTDTVNDIVAATTSGSSNITPTVSASGYITQQQATPGAVTFSGANTYQLDGNYVARDARVQVDAQADTLDEIADTLVALTQTKGEYPIIITQNGQYSIGGYDTVTVEVDNGDGGDTAVLGTKTLTTNGTYYAENDNYDGYAAVTVDVDTANLGTKTITTNGTYRAANDGYDGYTTVTVNVSSGEKIQSSKTVKITSEGTTLIAPDTGYTGLRQVYVETDIKRAVANVTLTTTAMDDEPTSITATYINADGVSVTVEQDVTGQKSFVIYPQVGTWITVNQPALELSNTNFKLAEIIGDRTTRCILVPLAGGSCTCTHIY